MIRIPVSRPMLLLAGFLHAALENRPKDTPVLAFVSKYYRPEYPER